jgi:hypothetical protein
MSVHLKKLAWSLFSYDIRETAQWFALPADGQDEIMLIIQKILGQRIDSF